MASLIGASTFALVRPYWAILAYLAAVVLGAALLSPLLYSLAGAHGAGLQPLKSLANYPFSRYVQRSLLFLALVGLYPFLRSQGLSSWRQLGLGRGRQMPAHLLTGFLAGFVSLGTILILGLAAGARRWDPHHSPGEIGAHAARFILTAIVVSFIEELFFRGAIFGALRRTVRWRTALCITSLFYAAVHFLGPAEPVAPAGWSAGLATLGEMITQGFQPARLIPAFFSLACAGWVLGLAYQRLGSLYFSIGLHAGWIFWLKFYAYLTEKTPGVSSEFWGSGRLIDGWVAFFLLLLMAVLAALWNRKSGTTSLGPTEPKLSSAPLL